MTADGDRLPGGAVSVIWSWVVTAMQPVTISQNCAL